MKKSTRTPGEMAAEAQVSERVQNGMLRSTLSKATARMSRPDIDAIVSRAEKAEALGGIDAVNSGKLRSALRRANWPEPVINFLIYRSL